MRTTSLRRVFASRRHRLRRLGATSAFAAPALGLARDAGTVTNNLDGTFTVQFTVTVANVGVIEGLTGVSVTDALSGVSPRFGTQTAGTPGYGQYAIASAPAFASACPTLTLNGAFDGSTSTQLVTGTLAIGDSCRITYSVRWFPASQTSFTTQSSGAAQGALTSQATTDTSDNGTVADADGDGIANESGENDSDRRERAERLVRKLRHRLHRARRGRQLPPCRTADGRRGRRLGLRRLHADSALQQSHHGRGDRRGSGDASDLVRRAGTRGCAIRLVRPGDQRAHGRLEHLPEHDQQRHPPRDQPGRRRLRDRRFERPLLVRFRERIRRSARSAR